MLAGWVVLANARGRELLWWFKPRDPRINTAVLILPGKEDQAWACIVAYSFVFRAARIPLTTLPPCLSFQPASLQAEREGWPILLASSSIAETTLQKLTHQHEATQNAKFWEKVRFNGAPVHDACSAVMDAQMRSK